MEVLVLKLPHGTLQDVITVDGNGRRVANAVVTGQVPPEYLELYWEAVSEGNDIHLYGTRWYRLRADRHIELLDAFRARCKRECKERKRGHYRPFTSGHLRGREDCHELVAHGGVDRATVSGT